MTLVLFIPHVNGFILLADKQNTIRGTIEKNEVLKLHLQSENGPAVGCAGHTLLIQTLFSHLREEHFAPNQNVCDTIRRKLNQSVDEVTEDARRYGPGLEEGELRTDMLVFQRNNGNFVLSKFTGLVVTTIANLLHIQAVPECNPEAARYLDIDTSDLPEGLAIKVGEEILRQMSFGNYKIGSPEYHGYDLIKVNNAGFFATDNIAGTLPRVDPTELLDYILQREEEDNRNGN